MSRKVFDDECPGCRPAVLDLTTRQPLPDDHPIMLAIMEVWGQTTRAEREAFHRVTCLNSRVILDMYLVDGLNKKFTAAMDKLE